MSSMIYKSVLLTSMSMCRSLIGKTPIFPQWQRKPPFAFYAMKQFYEGNGLLTHLSGGQERPHHGASSPAGICDDKPKPERDRKWTGSIRNRPWSDDAPGDNVENLFFFLIDDRAKHAVQIITGWSKIR
jgi:hypothetical protein